ncbi:hypothetical protein GCM10023115_32360 [Pontixanthobacter gangjinensis]|uniref:DUF6624 domain-containing protein n=1 Tax=Christiangramia aestuarii TaxID=1028746 RepID=UPI00192E6B6C|nr:DUF6624 domain-containing protein [Christiangramia aestuarii]
MKKLILSAFILFLNVHFSLGQNSKEYHSLIGEAWELYQSQDYEESAETYMEAFSETDSKARTTDRYNAACSWALAGNVDNSFVQLFKVAEEGNYTNLEHISTDPDLDILHSDKRWSNILEIVKDNKEKAEANFNKPLVAELEAIYESDQAPRRKYSEVLKEHGQDSEEMIALIQKLQKTDSINLIKVRKIIDEHGWLGPDIIGKKGNATLFLVIQHADLEIQQQYLPLMREAVEKGDARASSLALLEDRIALRQGKRQIYGSQVARDQETGEYYVSPLKDPENVNKRRAEVGLPPIEDYVSRWGIEWDAEEYKAELPELEARINK